MRSHWPAAWYTHIASYLPSMQHSAIVLLTLLFTSIGCAKVDHNCPNDLLGDRRGFIHRHFTDSGGTCHHYMLFIPHDYEPSQQLPVILFLNGKGENGSDGAFQISNNFGLQLWEMQSHFPFLAVMPQCREGHDWSARSDDARWAMEILEEVMTEFDADRDRVTLTGVSSGGLGVWQIAAAYPDKFSCLAPLCAGGTGNVRPLVKANMPVWFFYNRGDQPGLVAVNAGMRRSLISSGLSPLVTTYAKSGHDCWNEAWRNLALFEWMLHQRISTNRNSPRFEKIASKDVRDGWTRNGNLSWTVNKEELTAIGDGNGMLVSPALSCRELHVDFFLPASEVGTFQVSVGGQNDGADEVLKFAVHAADIGPCPVSTVDSLIGEITPAAQRSLHLDEWNDLRIRVDAAGIHVLLNGWLAFARNVSSQDLPVWKFVIASSSSAQPVRWRYFRRTMLGDNAPVVTQPR